MTLPASDLEPSGAATPGTVAALWRYPVASFGGEPVSALGLARSGAAGDRVWRLHDVATDRPVTAYAEPRLLHAAAWVAGQRPGPAGRGGRAGRAGRGGPVVAVRLPDGGSGEAGDPLLDEALSVWLGREVALRAQPAPAYGRVHLVTTATLRAAARLHPAGAWAPERFRPNLLVDVAGSGWTEEGWLGARVTVGAAVELSPYQATVRCAVTTYAQPGLAADPAILAALEAGHHKLLGVYARVDGPGEVGIGDRVAG